MARKSELWAEILIYRPGTVGKKLKGEAAAAVDWLADKGASVTVCTSSAATRARLGAMSPTVLFLDFSTGAEIIDAVEIESFLHLQPGLRMIALVRPEDSKSTQLGEVIQRRFLYDFQTFPLDKGRLLFAVGHIRGMVAVERLARRSRQLEAEANGDTEPFMVGSHPSMLRVYSAIRKIGRTDTPVLITGESGTGKELVAHAVHERSTLHDGPFVAINCAGIPSTLIASELFGHEKGAFTDARQRKLGKIELASNGTLFLDEIGDLPFELQGHMLRFLQEKTIERVGGTRTIEVLTRVIAATNVDLWEAVEEGRFRKDLYYRLNVLPLHLPPLRERGSDIDLVAQYFLRRFKRELDRPELALRPNAVKALRNYSWPGNVRELISVIRRAVVMAESRWIDTADLGLSTLVGTDSCVQTLDEARGGAERDAIQQALQKHNDNINRAAKELGVSRVTLYRLIEKHAIIYSPRGKRKEVGWTPDIDYIN